jgi:hypothetical protein
MIFNSVPIYKHSSQHHVTKRIQNETWIIISPERSSIENGRSAEKKNYM